MSGERVVDRADAQLAYRVEGKGPALVLLHGGLVDSRSWSRQLELAADLTLVLPDTRGFGASRGSIDGVGLGGLVDDVAAVADHAGLDQFALLGFSMGGVVAAAFALRHPARLRALVLAGSPAGGHVPPPLSGDDPVRAHVERAFSAAFRDASGAFLDEYVAMARSNEGAMAVVRAALADGPRLEELAGITVPTLVVHGSEDAAVPVDHARRVAERIPGARLEVVAGAGHSLHLERPVEFNALVHSAVDSVGA